MALLHKTKAEEKKKKEEKAAANQEPKKSGKSVWRSGGNKNKFKRENVTCNRCNKPEHLAKDCRVNLRRTDTKGKCFNCLEPGHYSNQCPKPRREGPNAQVNAIEAVPIFTQPPKDTGRSALEGKILILGNIISILFDYGASHTFISHTIVKSLNLKTENTTNPLVVSNPIAGTSYLNLVCKDLVLDVSNVDFYCCAMSWALRGTDLF